MLLRRLRGSRPRGVGGDGRGRREDGILVGRLSRSLGGGLILVLRRVVGLGGRIPGKLGNTERGKFRLPALKKGLELKSRCAGSSRGM